MSDKPQIRKVFSVLVQEPMSRAVTNKCEEEDNLTNLIEDAIGYVPTVSVTTTLLYTITPDGVVHYHNTPDSIVPNLETGTAATVIQSIDSQISDTLPGAKDNV